MKNKKTKILLMLLPVIFINLPALALDINEYSDFSSRSLIMNKMNNTENITQEQRELLISKKLFPNAECLNQQIKKNNLDNVRLLLEAKTNPNNSYYSEYPIYTAAKANNFEILKLLYEYGAKLDKGFYSELYEAVKNKNTEMAQFLIDKGARVNYQDSINNNTILYMSLKNNMYNISAQLIAKGAKADPRSVKYIKKKKLYNLIEDK